MWQDILNNLISDAIFLISVGILSFVLSMVYLVISRKPLLNFFGIDNSRRIIIYISKLKIPEYTARDSKNITRSFQGEAVTYQEFRAATQLQALFNFFLRSWGNKPSLLDKVLIADVDVQIDISPAIMDDLDHTASFIALGSSAFNAASMYLDTHNSALIKSRNAAESVEDPLTNNTINNPLTSGSASVMEVTSNNQSGGAIYPSGWILDAQKREQNDTASRSPGATSYTRSSRRTRTLELILDGIPPISDSSVGYLERIYDVDTQRSIFCAAGISEHGTMGAAYYLKAHWRELAKKFGATKSFVIVLKFDPVDYHRPTILFEKSS